MLKLETLDSYDKFVELKPIWNSLLAQTETDIPFLTFEWLSCWWKSYGKQKELLIILVKDDEEIIGIAPLMISRIKFRGLPARAISFMANYHSNRIGFIILKEKEEVINLILGHIKSSAYKFDLLYFDFLLKNSDSDIFLKKALVNNRMKYIEFQSLSSPYVLVEEAWDSYMKKRSRNLRGQLRRITNLFERKGIYEIVKYTEDKVQEAIVELFQVSRNTWKYRAKTAIASNKENITFYSSLANSVAGKKWLNIWILKLNNTPIAFAYNLDYKNKIFFLKMGFDENYAKLSPSEFLNSFTVKDCFENKRIEYDWLGDDEPFKMKWTSLCREHNKYYIFNNNVLGSILQFLELKIIEPVKKSQCLTNFFKKSRKLFFAEAS